MHTMLQHDCRRTAEQLPRSAHHTLQCCIRTSISANYVLLGSDIFIKKKFYFSYYYVLVRLISISFLSCIINLLTLQFQLSNDFTYNFSY